MGLLGWIKKFWTAPSGNDRYWIGTTSTDTTNVLNWSATDGGAGGASVPVTGDHAYFTGNGKNPCTFGAHMALLHLTVEAGYDQKLDLATYNLTMDSAGNVTLDGTGEFDCGSGSHSINGGDLDYEDQTTFTDDTSTWTFSGTCGLTTSGDALRTVTIASGTTTIPASQITNIADTLTVNGTLSIGSSASATVIGADVVLGNSGIISGAGTLWILYPGTAKGLVTFPAGATISVGTFKTTAKGANPLAYGGAFSSAENIFTAAGGNAGSIVPEAEAYTFSGNVTFSNTGTADLTWDNATNGTTSVTVQGILTLTTTSTGDVIVDSSGVATDWILQGNVVDSIINNGLTWTRGTGTITLSGTSAQDVDFAGETGEDIVINKSAETVTLSGALSTESVTLTDGTLDIDGNDITTVSSGNFTQAAGTTCQDTATGGMVTVAGDFAVNGANGNECVWNGPDLTVSGTAVATYTTATNSDASGGTEIDATIGSTDGGGNANWLFGVLVAQCLANGLFVYEEGGVSCPG